MSDAVDTTADLEHDTHPAHPNRTPWVFAIWLVVAGLVGQLAAFTLTIEKFHKLVDADAAASCDFSVLVQCTANLQSWQGSVFGFPNPIIGLIAWTAPIVVGVSLLAGARFASWYWILFHLGVTFAFVFVIWLMSQSIFVLGTLCIWCLVTWSVTIPTFWVVTARNLAAGVYGERARVAGRALGTWVVPLTLVCYAIIALLAQLQLDAFNRL